MPLYDFKCPICDTVFEVLVRRSDDPVTCPQCPCDVRPVKLVSRGTSFVLAGSGWYRDGYTSNGRGDK